MNDDDDGAAGKHTSGKLRYKQSREERKRDFRRAEEEEEERRSRREAKRRRKRRAERGTEIDEDYAAGPSRHPAALFGDDLLRAERYEAQQREEQNWSAKLDGLMQDDLRGGFSEAGGNNPFASNSADDAAWEEEIMRMRGDQFDGQQGQEIPKRWQDAAKGFETKMGRGAAGLKELDDEEYAEYIREGMYRRKHARDIAFEEERRRKWQESQAKKAAAKEEQREAKRKQRQAEEKEQSKKALTSAREAWERNGVDLAAPPTVTSAELTLVWPVYPGPEITKESISFFLFHDAEKAEAAKRLRKALLRYHPDRFLSSKYYTSLEDEGKKRQVKEAVEKVSKILSDIVDDRRA